MKPTCDPWISDFWVTDFTNVMNIQISPYSPKLERGIDEEGDGSLNEITDVLALLCQVAHRVLYRLITASIYNMTSTGKGIFNVCTL